MSQVAKRDAATAFDDPPDGTPQPRKRYRKRREQTTLAVPKESSHAVANPKVKEQKPLRKVPTEAVVKKQEVKNTPARLDGATPAISADKQERKRHRKRKDSNGPVGPEDLLSTAVTTPDTTKLERKRHRKRKNSIATVGLQDYAPAMAAETTTKQEEPASPKHTQQDDADHAAPRTDDNHPALVAGGRERRRRRKPKDPTAPLELKDGAPTVAAADHTTEAEPTSPENIEPYGVNHASTRPKNINPSLVIGERERKRYRKTKDKIAPVLPNEITSTMAADTDGIQTEPTSPDSTQKLSSEQGQKEFPARLGDHHVTMDVVKQERKKHRGSKPAKTKKMRSDEIVQPRHVASHSRNSPSLSRRPPESQEMSKPGELTLRKTGEPEDRENRWTAATTNGGMFIDQDPLLTEDGQFLILATHSEIQVYSTKTSLLVRSLQMGSKTNITSCAVSTADPSWLYVSSSQGKIVLWDWTTAAQLAEYTLERGVRRILPVYSQDSEETLLLLSGEGRGLRNLVVCRVNQSQGSLTDKQTILERSHLSSVRSYAQGSVLIAYAEDKILIGLTQISATGGLDLSHTWREVSVVGYITSLDAQVNSGKSKTSRKVPYLDVAVGLRDGSIDLYEDLLFKLIAKEKKNIGTTEDISARKLHWHRTAVNTVKWSRDRNYVISGGNETVLVVWQLDSNQKQFLPHLSTPILNLTVSSAGSSYALRLADNSVMILSTADLLPSTNISGLALGHASQASSTMLFHPRTAGRLIAAVPANAFSGGPSTSLQVYDVDTSIQFARQALTRNTITASNVAPTGQPVQEPKVGHVDLSHDGNWLATVDEWTPQAQDLEAMYVSSDSTELKGRATETSLRLWLWNEDANAFEQVTRIDEPHSPGPNSVLGMSFDPTKLELATIGADATVRIWSPKSRHRNGVSVRNSANEQLYTWTSSRTIHCEHDALTDPALAHAALAYAEDGSVVAASWSFSSEVSASTTTDASPPNQRFIHLIDPSSGKIVFSLPSLLSSGPAKLLFHTRYLLCLSSTLQIFDTISCQSLIPPTEFDPSYVPPLSRASIFLSHNKFDGTFAIGLCKSEWPRMSKVFVLSFGNENTKRAGEAESGGVDLKIEYEGSFTGTLKGMLALNTSSGYFLVDERNQTRILRQSGTSGALALTHGGRKVKTETEEVTRSLDSIFGQGIGGGLSSSTDGADASSSMIGNPSLVRGLPTSSAQEDDTNGEKAGSLGSVLSFPSSAMAPSPVELFNRVVRALGRVGDEKQS